MDEVALSEADGIGYEIPDIPHVELVLEGLNDTLEERVEGNEALTGAQVYLAGVLRANGLATMQQVEGNEGFFTTVGSGAKAAYEYVMKMFRSMWDFFFKRDAPKKADEATKELEGLKDQLDTASNGGSSEAETDEALKKMAAVAKAAGDDNLEQVAREAVKESHDKKKAAVIKLAKALPGVNKAGQERMQKRVSRMSRVNQLLVNAIKEARDEAAKMGDTPHKVFAKAVSNMQTSEEAAKASLTALNSIKEVNTLDQAKTLLEKTLKEVAAIKVTALAMESMRGSLSQEITAAKAAVEGNAENKGAKDALAELQATMRFCTKAGNCLKNILSESVHLQEAVNGIFFGGGSAPAESQAA